MDPRPATPSRPFRPLRWIVGYRVRRFDAAAREALARVPNVTHIPVHFSPRPDMFSNDGLHPSETSQRRLAKIIAGTLTPLLAGRALGKPASHG